MKNNHTKTKVVVIGLDGATWDIIKPMVKQGKLPHLAEIMENGVHGDLASTIHPITPQAWTSFMTGKNAGKHGIFDFTTWKPNTYNLEFINASRRSAQSIFKILSDAGKQVGAVAIPFTFPPETLNGFMLSGMDSPGEDARAVNPPELYQKIRDEVGPYYIHLGSPVGRKQEVDKLYRDFQIEDENRTDVSLYLMKGYDLDLFMTVYNNVDRAQHQFFTEDTFERKGKQITGISLIEKVYEQADAQVGRIKQTLAPDTVLLLMSDHGAGPIRRVFFLNRWLEENGFLTYKEKRRSLGFEMAQQARGLAKRWLPRWAKSAIKNKVSKARDRLESYLCFSDIDWEKTQAYGFGMYGNIYLNLKDREPQGVVAPSERDTLLSRIAGQLEQLSDPDTGEMIVERVLRREELYHGENVDKAPDLLIKWKDYSYYTSMNVQEGGNSLFGPCQNIDSSEFQHVGTHRLNGIFMAAGPMIKKAAQIEGAEIVDVAPTILYILGQSIPEDMDGKLLNQVFSPEYLEKFPPQYTRSSHDESQSDIVSYSEEEEDQIRKRLEGLGYIE